MSLSERDIERVAEAVYRRGVTAAASVPTLSPHELEQVREIVREELRQSFGEPAVELEQVPS